MPTVAEYDMYAEDKLRTEMLDDFCTWWNYQGSPFKFVADSDRRTWKLHDTRNAAFFDFLILDGLFKRSFIGFASHLYLKRIDVKLYRDNYAKYLSEIYPICEKCEKEHPEIAIRIDVY